MAIVATASTATAGNQTAGTVVLTVAGAGIAVNDLIVVFVAADNSGSSGTAPAVTPTDTGSNAYGQDISANRTAGSAVNDGCYTTILWSKATGAVSVGGTITLSFTPSVTAKAAAYQAFSGVNVSVDTQWSASSGTTYTSGAVTNVALGGLVVAAAANESNTPPTADVDTTGGAWLGGTAVSGGSGGDATKMSLRYGYKITDSAPTAQTFNGSTGVSTDWAAVIQWFSATVVPVPIVGATRARVAWS